MQIDIDRIMNDIDDSLALLERLGIKVETGCPCGCLLLKSVRTNKSQCYYTIDDMTYLNVLGFTGPAFRQLVTRGAAGEEAGQTTFDCFLEAVAIARSCCGNACAREEGDGEEDNYDDIC
jgi:hypothetical protein